MSATTWVLILLVISFAILLTIVIKEFQPKAVQKPEVDQDINQNINRNTSMENSEDLTPAHLSKEVILPMIPETPWEYGENEIKLLFQDPYNLYAYWEITDKTIRELKEKLADDFNKSSETLRLFQINKKDGKNISLILNQPISNDQRSWYFHVGKPEGTFFIELGRYLSNGSFILIARSNLVDTPPDKISDIIDEEWALIDKDQQLLYQHYSYTKGTSSEGVSSFSFYNDDKH